MLNGADYYVATLDRAMTRPQLEELKDKTRWSVLSFRDEKEVRLMTNLPEFVSFPNNIEVVLQQLAEKYGFTIISFGTGTYSEQPVQAV